MMLVVLMALLLLKTYAGAWLAWSAAAERERLLTLSV